MIFFLIFIRIRGDLYCICLSWNEFQLFQSLTPTDQVWVTSYGLPVQISMTSLGLPSLVSMTIGTRIFKKKFKKGTKRNFFKIFTMLIVILRCFTSYMSRCHISVGSLRGWHFFNFLRLEFINIFETFSRRYPNCSSSKWRGTLN